MSDTAYDGTGVGAGVGTGVGGVGAFVGAFVGVLVGFAVGDFVGAGVGTGVGDCVGNGVGDTVGDAVGEGVGQSTLYSTGFIGIDQLSQSHIRERASPPETYWRVSVSIASTADSSPRFSPYNRCRPFESSTDAGHASHG